MKVIGTHVDSISYAPASDQIVKWTQAGDGHYVCIANVHMLMEAYDSPEFAAVVNGADLVVPDGMPLVWMMRAKGVWRQERVYGPILMLHVLDAATRDNIPVGVYGG